MSGPKSGNASVANGVGVSGARSLRLTMLAVGQMLGSLIVHALALSIVGVGAEMDAFVASQALPAFAAAVVGAALLSVWQSRLSTSAGDPAHFRRVLASLLGRTLLLLGGGGLLVWTFRAEWIALLVPGLEGSAADLAERLAGPAVLAMVLNAYFAATSLAMRALGKYELPDIIAVAGAVFAAAGVWLLVPIGGVVAAAWLLVLRAAMQFALSMVFLRGAVNVRAPPGIDRADWRQLRPLLLGGSLYKTGPLVDRFWSSHAPVGAVAVYHLAHSTATAAATLIDRGLCAPLLPDIARAVADQRFDGVRRMLANAALRILAASLAFLLAWIALRGPVEWAFRVLFAAHSEQASQAWLSVLWLTPMLPAAGIGSVVVSVLYALGDTRTPAVVASAAFIAGLAVKAVAFSFLGVPGLALGTSIFYIINVTIVLLLLRRRLTGGAE